MRIIILAVLMCACQAAQDPENCQPPELNDGFFIPNSKSYKSGEKISYGCNTGLKPDLKTWWGEITCKNGEWSHTPRCINNTWCITTYVPNAKPDVLQASRPGAYDFECDHGYWFEGRKSIAKCVAGSWTLPECKRNPDFCAPPPRVNNGMITTPYRNIFENGQKLEYICARGFRLDGVKFNTCRRGTWSSNPTCVEVKCADRPRVAYARAAEGLKHFYNHGDTVRFMCDEGYEFEGTNTARCEDGTWKLPVCKVEVKCNQPRVYDGRAAEGLKFSYNHGDTVRFMCDEGYKFEGTNTARCEDGTWKLPVCKDSTSCSRPYVENARPVYRLRALYTHGEHVQFACDRGYRLEHVSAYATCILGTWRLPVCKGPENCRPPQLQNDGFFVPNSENYRTGDKITYGCNTGLKPDLKTWWGEITCKNGEWSHTPRCINNTWCITTHVPNAKPDVLQASRPGAYDFECDHGYWIEGGKPIAECVAGSWTLPECKQKPNSCAPPPRVNNGMITTPYRNIFEDGEKLEYICARGFRLDGDNMNTCRRGTWSSNPRCVEVKCADRPRVAYARATEGFKLSYNHGDTVRFMCNRGYEFEGTDTARCEDGTWKLPVCKGAGGGGGAGSLHPDQFGVLLPVRACGSHPLITNGDITELPSGKELKVQCARYYKLDGPQTVGCVKGEWTPLPVCKPPCKVEGERIHSGQSDEYLQDGDEKRYYCGFLKKITVRCLDGTPSYGECVPVLKIQQLYETGTGDSFLLPLLGGRFASLVNRP